MKKLLIMAGAVAAMAACTKGEVVYEDTSAEIGLSPVSYTTTKTVYGPYEGTSYSQAEQFKVFAQHTASPAGTAFSQASSLNPYLVDVTFGCKGTQVEGKDVWGGTPSPYYWPKTGSLYFTGYSPAAANVESASYDWNQGGPRLTLTGFEQGTYSWTGLASNPDYHMVDLLYFDVHNTTTSVDGGIQSVTFRHALSWLDFNFKCATDGLDGLFTIKKVTLTKVGNKETFLSGYGDSDNKWPVPAWTANDTGKEIVLYDAGMPLTTNLFSVHDVLIIPQNIDGVLEIVYDQKAYKDAPSIEQVENLTLTGGDGSSDDSKKGQWIINKHYVYNITFTADEILLSPSILEWDPAIVSDIEVK